jgi:hypothetical protein
MKPTRLVVAGSVIGLGALLMLLVLLNGPLGATTSACRSADTVIVPERLTYLKNFISKADSVYKLPRDSIGLASQNAAKVKLETKSTTCQSGVNALNAILQTPGTSRQIWLFALGSGYAIQDPTIPHEPGQPDPLYFFDSQFVYKGTLMVD